ncbi:hypothetical protein SynROS8604_02313 [Synechococcus sp. ROS8604]|jgi:hypothetical protein|nr:hypothetical protein SynROS8604_02313 [Synechococcus sp. ROS8604]
MKKIQSLFLSKLHISFFENLLEIEVILGSDGSVDSFVLGGCLRAFARTY